MLEFREVRPALRFTTVVVIGGSVAGLLAAAALAPHARRVVVVDRDRLPDDVGPRSGTPHSTHSHGLLASGRLAMESLVPGLTADLVAHGAAADGDVGSSGSWWLGGGLIADCRVGLPGLAVSRLLLESVLRDRVRAVPGVQIRDRVDVLGLTAAGRAVTGVRILGRDDGSAAETIDADLVVDASGSLGHAASSWFPEHGWTAPAEDVVEIGVRYVTTRVPARPGDLDGGHVAVVAATPDVPRGGVAILQEDGVWTITLYGYVDQKPPLDPDALAAWAGTVVSPDLAGLLADRPLLERPRAYRFRASRRRRFERLPRPPRGYVAIGDAVCSFNPAFGQGMSVAALEARALAEEVARGPEQLESRYHRRAAGVVDGAWDVVVGADLDIGGVTGRRPRGHRAVSSYVRRAQRVARQDAVVAAALLRVVNLVEPPASLMAPAIARRVLFPATASGTHGTHGGGAVSAAGVSTSDGTAARADLGR